MKVIQSCLTLCDPIDGSPPGSPVPGILQARTLEWVAISFSNAWKWKVKGKSLSRVQLFATPRIAAYPAPPSMGFSRQEYWSGVPLPSPTRPYYYVAKDLFPSVSFTQDIMFAFQQKTTRHTKRQKDTVWKDQISIITRVKYGRNVGIIRPGIWKLWLLR